MFSKLKSKLYFHIAGYFRFFAKIRLQLWHPKVIVVTGSNGKTTLLHLLESQFGKKARYSHHANSSFGIPFDILDLHRKTLRSSEWISLIISAPLSLFKKFPKEKIYIVEADADRPHEGKFLADLLTPDVVLWVSVGRTHSMNFDTLVSQRKFETVEEAIAFEYGYFLEKCRQLVIIDGDSAMQKAQLNRTTSEVKEITKRNFLTNYKVEKGGTTFTIFDSNYLLQGLLPEEIYLSIAMCKEIVSYFEMDFDPTFSHFILPPGRGTLLNGIKQTTIIDSSYNGNLGSIKAMLEMFEKYPATYKWVILGDMKELGKEEKEEHELLAELLNTMQLDQIILIGKLITKYTLPKITKRIPLKSFYTAPEAMPYLQEQIKGKEALLFKGSQSLYLEGLIEQLLEKKEDLKKLPRQEQFWITQRNKLGFD